MTEPATGGWSFAILGPLLVRHDGRQVTIRSPRERTLLATLLLRAGEPVPLEHLAARLWEREAPADPRDAVHSCVRRLRRRFEPDGHVLLRTAADGYVAEPPWLDLDAFRTAIAAADRARQAGRREEEAARIAAALELWRAEPLADVPADGLRRDHVPGLVEERLAALHRYVDAELCLGHAGRVVAPLRTAVTDHPLRERFRVQLILALDRSGNPTEALVAYEDARRRLAADLGADPGPELRALHAALLRAATTHDGGQDAREARDDGEARDGEAGEGAPAASRPPDPAGPRRSAVVPRQLPPDVPGFTGRTVEGAALDRLAATARTGDGPVVAVVAGTAGVGKTGLAVHWARRAAAAFPDGQLFVDLGGYRPEPARTTADALALLLIALGVGQAEMPDEAEARTALLRSLTAERRLLLVLDNAESVAQVRPLLPTGPSALTVVTSRDGLAGLVARDGAVRVELHPFDEAGAAALLRALVTGGRTDAEPTAVRDLTVRTGGLALALRIVAEHLTARPDDPLAHVAAELTAAGPLAGLDGLNPGDDPYTSVRSVLSWSYRSLPAAVAALYRRVALHPAADFDTAAAAALAGVDTAQAHRDLDALAAAHLVVRDRTRWRFHDLLRDHARERATDEDGRPVRDAALDRLYEHHLDLVTTAMAGYGGRDGGGDGAGDGAGDDVPVTGIGDLLDAELPGLVATAGHALAAGRPDVPVRLAAALQQAPNHLGHHLAAVRLHAIATDAAARLGDPAAEATARKNLALARNWTGAHDEAVREAERARACASDAGDDPGLVADIDTCLGLASWNLGRFADAVRHHEAALAAYRAAGDDARQGIAHNNLGVVAGQAGDLDRATRHFEAALERYRAAGVVRSQATALSNLGEAAFHLGDHELARQRYAEALDTGRRVGSRMHVNSPLVGLGKVCLALGRTGEARAYLDEALEISRSAHETRKEVSVLVALSRVDLTENRAADALARALAAVRLSGGTADQPEACNAAAAALVSLRRFGEARERYAEALAGARDIGEHAHEAVALDGLATVHSLLGDDAAAAGLLRLAVARYEELGLPEGDGARERLAALTSRT